MTNITIEEDYIDDGGTEGTLVTHTGDFDGLERRAFFSGEAHTEIAQYYREYLEDMLYRTSEVFIQKSFDSNSI